MSDSSESSELWNVMVLDPGGTTGVVNIIVPVDGGSLRYSAVEVLSRCRSAGLLYQNQIRGQWQEQARMLVRACVEGRRWLDHRLASMGAYSGGRQVLVMESYVQSSEVHKDSVLAPFRIQTCLEWVCDSDSGDGLVDSVVLQQPAAKAQITDARLRRWGLYRAGAPHANDAMRHALVYLRSMERVGNA